MSHAPGTSPEDRGTHDRGAHVWRADQLSHPEQPGYPTGFTALDAQLPGGGWPPGALTELLLTAPGHGEWRLLAPALSRLSQSSQLVVWAGSPAGLRPYAPCLVAQGLPLHRLLWVDAASAADAAWAAEQALATQGCAAVYCWAPELPTTALRRLHLAARDSNSLLFVARPPHAARQSSPAALRLGCEAAATHPGRLAVRVLKRRGPPCEEALLLDTLPLFSPALAQQLRRLVPTPSTAPSQPAHTLSTRLSPHLSSHLRTDLSPSAQPPSAHSHARPVAPAVPVALPASA